MKQVPMRNVDGEVVNYALVSDEDFDEVLKFKWYQQTKREKNYAETSHNNTILSLHHLIIGKPAQNLVVDHINGNSLDNTRPNLRFATYSQNSQNRNITNKEGYTGIYFSEEKQHWRVYCGGNYLGTFRDETEAALQYDKCAFIIYGEHAKTNGLIRFEEVTETFNDVLPAKEERTLPKNITFRQRTQRYYAQLEFRKEKYSSIGFLTIVEAEQALIVLKKEVEAKTTQKQLNIFENPDGSIVLRLNKGEVIVDKESISKLQPYVWFIDEGYARGSVEGTVVYMHRFLMQASDGDIIDHINVNSLDNRMCNLRISCAGKNNHNRKKKENCTSKYYGVYKRKNGKFEVRIRKDKIKYHVGTYNTEVEAALAYNKKAEELYGTFARLNVIEAN